MVVKLGSNIASLTAQRRLAEGTTQLAKSYERLSSGMRINRASDDAAGLAISESLRAGSRIFSQAIRNVNDGISFLSIAEGALTELSSITTRQKELAEQAANGVYSLAQRRALDTEAHALQREFNRILATTEFNGIKMFSDNSVSLNIEAGFGAAGSINVNTNQALKRTVGTGDFTGPTAAGITGSSQMFYDLNKDGHLDIIDSSSTNTAYMLNNGSGGFGARTVMGAGGWTPGLGDYNGDGDIDLVVADFTSNNFIVYQNNGSLSFTQTQSFAMQGGVTSGIKKAYSGDLNGDGKEDIVVAHTPGAGPFSLEVFLNNGSGSFSTSQNITGITNYNSGAALGDIDGDGDLDIVSNGAVLTNSGNGTFSATATVSGLLGGAISDNLVDFNNDGILDYATSHGASGAGINVISVALGTGSGSFLAVRTYATSNTNTRLTSLVAGDLNSDGYMDLASLDLSNQQIQTFLNGGDGTFASFVTIAHTTVTSGGLAAGDIDGDNRIELVAYLGIYQEVTAQTSQSERLNLLTQNSARSALITVESQQQRISAELGRLGAARSRFEVAANVLSVQNENYLAANSRIRDADIASESAELTRLKILQQAASAVLAQANQQPALALSLLGGV